MPTYRVEWAIDVDAETPEEAARKARDYQQWPRPGYWVGVFDVIEHDAGGDVVRVDLDELDQQARPEGYRVERQLWRGTGGERGESWVVYAPDGLALPDYERSEAAGWEAARKHARETAPD